MTVSYTAQVTSCRRFGCFWRLLFRWKGSIYKLLWPNLMVYSMCYATLSLAYRFLLNERHRATFEKFSLHCQTYSDLIPVSFVLGFYVSIVIKRWWDQYLTIPWPDPLAVFVSAFLKGQDERARLMRRTIMRYANLSLLLTLRMMCPTVKKRFPTPEHIVDAGFLLANEKIILDKLEAKTSHPKYWLPLVWATAVVSRARREGKIGDDFSLKTLIDEINKFRGGCGGLLNYDWISIPLVYTQVVTLAVYTYFAASLMGNQYLDPNKGYPNHTIDLIVPLFTLLQFFFYMGWLLVAETLVNPFGEDDDDFEVNWLIDRNLQISYVIVDEMHEEHPELIKDQYWDQVFPAELPYTEATKQFSMEPFLGSAFGVDVPLHMQNFILLSDLVSEKEESQKETTPVSIKRMFQPNDEYSYSARSELEVDSLGRSVSLINPNWKAPKHKESSVSQACSMNSVFKQYNSEDYQDGVFKMSDVSLLASRRNLTTMTLDPSEQTNFMCSTALDVSASSRRRKMKIDLSNFGKPHHLLSGWKIKKIRNKEVSCSILDTMHKTNTETFPPHGTIDIPAIHSINMENSQKTSHSEIICNKFKHGSFSSVEDQDNIEFNDNLKQCVDKEPKRKFNNDECQARKASGSLEAPNSEMKHEEKDINPKVVINLPEENPRHVSNTTATI